MSRCGAVAVKPIGTPVEPCELEAGHAGSHQGYAPVVDEVVFWPRQTGEGDEVDEVDELP